MRGEVAFMQAGDVVDYQTAVLLGTGMRLTGVAVKCDARDVHVNTAVVLRIVRF